jgi:ATP-binding cassette, subfamily C, bacterial LapB
VNPNQQDQNFKPVIDPKGESILRTLSTFREQMPWIVSSSVAINLLALAIPLFMLQVFDRVVARGSIDTLTIIAVGATAAILLESFLRIIRSHLSAWIAARFEHKAMIEIASRTLAMPLHEFERQGAGAYQEQFKGVQSLKQFYSGQTFQQIIDLPFTLLYILIVLLISVWVGLLLLLGYAAFAGLVFIISKHHDFLVKERKVLDLRRNNFLVEVLNNIHTLKALAMESAMLRRYERLHQAGAKAFQNLTYALDLAAGIGAIFSPLMTMLVVALGAFLVVAGDLTTGELAACILLGLRSLAPIQRLGTIYTRHKQENSMKADVANFMTRPSLPDQNLTHPISVKEANSIEVKDLSYSFPGMKKPLLSKVSLSIQPGECVMIYGGNGSGKTTLLHLLSGVLAPNQGKVLINGHDIAQFDPSTVRERVAYLPQRTHLFEGSLLDNISVYNPERIDGALEKASALQIGDFVTKLPKGWDSPVGDAAAESMPPGFKQRIAVVRALSADPKIILFDDATAAVDSQGEASVLKYLNEIKGKHTIVLVSQRPSIQRLADRVLTLKDGTLVEGLHKDAAPSAALATPPTLTAQVSQGSDAPAADGQNNLWQRAQSSVETTFKNLTDLACCLPPLLKALGWRQSARDLAENLPYFTDTLDLTGFENTMAQLGFRPTDARCVLGSLDARTLPCLFLPESGRAFVVLSRKGNVFQVAYDVLSGEQSMTTLGLEGRAFFFAKADQKSVGQESEWVSKSLGRFRPLVVQAGLSSIVSGLVLITGSLFIMAAYNQIIPSGSTQTLFFLAFGVLLALIVGGFFIVHRAKILSTIAGRIDYLFGSTILQQIMGLSPSMTERSAVGAQMARISSFEAVRDLFTGPIASTILESPATIVVLVALAIINPVSLLVVLIVLAIYGVLYWLLEPATSRLVGEVGRTSTKRNEFTVEMLQKMRTIRECGGSQTWLRRFREISAEAAMASFKAEKMSAALVGISYFVMMFAGLMIVTITVPLTLSQTLGPGALLASMMLMWRVLGPIQTLFNNLTRIERVKVAVNQINNLMKIKGERVQSNASPIARGLKGRVEFQRVSFRYSLNVDPALVGVEFAAKPGDLIAITGPNGGGKSTLFKLLLGMYQPQAGSILIDGVDLRQLDPIELRRLIGYAPQEAHFFRATISQNMRLAKPDATDQEILHALEMAGALEETLALPKGLEDRLGDGFSEQLPASLRQKLSLARAYLTNAPIMLFDEPGAGLDDYGDQRFMQSLNQLKGRSTVFYISHRPSHIKLADTVLIFDRGYLRAAGKPSDLFKSPPAASASPVNSAPLPAV